MKLKEEWRDSINKIEPKAAKEMTLQLERISQAIPIFKRVFPLTTLIATLAARAKGMEV